jgi:hypothetical protein
MDRLEHLLIRKRAMMKAIQEDMIATIIAGQEKIGAVISTIQSTQTKCQEAIIEQVGDLGAEIQGMWRDEEALRALLIRRLRTFVKNLTWKSRGHGLMYRQQRLLEAIWQECRMQLADVEARLEPGGCRTIATKI